MSKNEIRFRRDRYASAENLQPEPEALERELIPITLSHQTSFNPFLKTIKSRSVKKESLLTQPQANGQRRRLAARPCHHQAGRKLPRFVFGRKCRFNVAQNRNPAESYAHSTT